MTYTTLPNFKGLIAEAEACIQLKDEEGAQPVFLVKALEKHLQQTLKALNNLKPASSIQEAEPNRLAAIRKLRPRGPRTLPFAMDTKTYQEKLAGALLARCIGCTLGSIVEFWDIEKMKDWARVNGDAFPRADYWTAVERPHETRYRVSRRKDYTRSGIKAVPADDDIAYTLAGLLVAEKYGLDFTTDQLGQFWKTHLGISCTAEKVAVENLKKGIPAKKAGERNNPYQQWIGAAIRADPWGYMTPGLPEKAAELAYRDACLSHRRNGLYGEMFWAAAIAAAFSTDCAVDALEIGLTEIPKQCLLARGVRWALKTAPRIADYEQARAAVDKRFKGMNGVHTVNNACLTVFGLAIGRGDIVKTLGQTVAMGLDNDCTAATAGSIAGAIGGRSALPDYLVKPFRNRIKTYIKNHESFRISDIVQRFTALAGKVTHSIATRN